MSIILKPKEKINISLKLDTTKEAAAVTISSNKPKKLTIVKICAKVEVIKIPLDCIKDISIPKIPMQIKNAQHWSDEKKINPRKINGKK